MLRRPRFLSSVRTTYHGAHAVSVAANIASRARRVVVPPAVRLQVHVRQLPDLARVFDAALQPAGLLVGADLQPVLQRAGSRSRPSPSRTPGASSRKRSVCSSVQNPITRSTPARLYQLRSKITTSPPAGRCGHVPLHVHLRLLPLGRARQGHDAEHPRAHALGDGLDRAALARGVASLEDDADLGAGRLDPLLHRDQLGVQLAQLGLVLLALHLRSLLRLQRPPLARSPFAPSCCFFLPISMKPPQRVS